MKYVEEISLKRHRMRADETSCNPLRIAMKKIDFPHKEN